MNELDNIPNEHHPLSPFLPENAKLLMLGSFPPKKERWSIDFFYPNLQNDMWRIMGYIFYDDKQYFVDTINNRFKYDEIIEFCKEKGLAIFDTAQTIKRLKDNASDKFLFIVDPTDISQIIKELPQCTAIVTTGEKATGTIIAKFDCDKPTIGNYSDIVIDERVLKFYRMPSSSRAYPLSIEKKAIVYQSMFIQLGLLAPLIESI
ncbi:MAG: uracil-DNA glycosylase family protein [Tannerellaceae bacterium]